MKTKEFKMTNKQAKGLVKAIQEWINWDIEEDIYEERLTDCVLCNEFLDVSDDGSDDEYKERCKACPVYQYTGRPDCLGTPDNKTYSTKAKRKRYTIEFGNKILRAAGRKEVK